MEIWKDKVLCPRILSTCIGWIDVVSYLGAVRHDLSITVVICAGWAAKNSHNEDIIHVSF